MPALRALAVAVAVFPTFALAWAGGNVARAADPEPDATSTANETAGADDASAAPFADAHFGPRYTIEAVVVRGNHKTATSLILAELSAIGLRQGKQVDASDPRVEAARYRLLTLGF